MHQMYLLKAGKNRSAMFHQLALEISQLMMEIISSKKKKWMIF